MTASAHDDTARLAQALTVIRRLKARVDELEQDRTPPVAVVGLGCRFPGAPDPEAFWRILCDGTSAIRDVPAARWDAGWYDPDRTVPGKSYCRRGGFIDGIDGFEPAFFGISPREAKRLDPQQRLLLEVSWEALEDAAIDPRSLEGSRTGVFVGVSEGEYQKLAARRGAAAIDMLDLTGTAASVAGGRLSYALGLQGPNIAIDTACSSSLVGVHLAAAALRNGECDLALAGGVNIMLSPETMVAFCRGGALAADGLCKTFDAAADGYGRGEGCGIVVLKRLADALADGDRVLAVVRGSAVNQDGRTNGLTAPSGAAQQAVIRQALDNAGLSPADIGYVEAHGTGTPLGDVIEANALGAVFRNRPAPVAVGSVKTVIGHLEAASGIAGLIKCIQILRHHRIPPNLNFARPNPEIPWADLPITVPTAMRDWPDGCTAAGVSSFGFSGTNAHVILERAPDPPPREEQTGRPMVLALSARTPEALRALAERYADALTGDGAPALADACHTAAVGRADFAHRLAVVANTAGECAGHLRSAAAGRRPAGVSVGQTQERPALAFVFTGQGAQHAGMGRRLFETHDGFRRTLVRCDAVLRESGLFARSLLDILFPAPGTADVGLIDRTAHAQPALFALECALVDLWRSWGVEPAIVLGHSTGEYAAAYAAGVFGLEDGLMLIAQRARLIESATAGGATAAVFADAAAVAEVIAPFAGVGVAGVNSPRETLIAGAAEAVAEAVAALKAHGLDSRPLKVPHAPHSPLIEAALPAFAEAARGVRFAPPRIPIVSNVTGAPVEVLDAAYWCRQMREPVRFAEGIASLAEAGCSVILEVGPQPVLQLLGRQSWRGGAARWLSSLWSMQDDWTSLLRCVAELWVSGGTIDRAVFTSGAPARKAALPTYPFQRTSFWLDSEETETVPRPIPTPPPTVPPARPTASPLPDLLRERLAVYLEMDPKDIDGRTSFLQLGAESLVLGRFAQDVEDACGVGVGLGRLFDDLDTVDALARYLEPLVATVVPAPAAAPTAAPVASSAPASSPSVPLPVAGPSDGLEAIVARQLEIMARQLELLGGAPERPSRPAAPAPRPQSVAPVVQGAALMPHQGAVPVPPRDLDAVQRRHLEELIAVYVRRTAASRQRFLTHRARRVETRIPPYRPETEPLAYPIVGASADGARFRDIDGNEYVDIAMGIGVHLCGHVPPFVAAAVSEQLSHGMQTGPVADLADEVAELFCTMTGMERVCFSVTGTSAVRGALRVAQAVTGRHRFVMFSGAYHGQDDRLLAVPAIHGDASQGAPMAPGIAPRAAADALVLPYGQPRSLELIREHGHELAAVLVEPVQSRNPDLQPAAFLKDLRRLTSELGIALIFDEVITGFRVHPGGAQAWFGIEADIAAYGKCLGGGLPISVVGGKAAYMDRVDGGRSTRPGFETTYVGSTFEMHPLALASMRAMLRHLQAEGPELQARLAALTTTLADRLNAVFADGGVPIRVLHFASIFRFAWKGNASYAFQPLEMELFHFHLIARGIYVWEGRTCFLSTAHTAADIDAIVGAVADTVDAMRRGGFLPPNPATPAAGRTLPLCDDQRTIRIIEQRQEPESANYCVAENLRLQGPFRLDACRSAVDGLVARHEALRTVFPGPDDSQTVLPAMAVTVAETDLSGIPDGAREDAFAAWLAAEIARPFDLKHGPLLRVSVVAMGGGRHHLVLVAHHIICDGWSMALMVEELAALYSTACGTAITLPPPTPFADFLAGRGKAAGSVDEAGRQAHWEGRFAGRPPLPALPFDRPATADPSHRGARHTLYLDPARSRAIRDLARAHQCTVFMVLLAGFALLVHRLSGRDTVVIGTPVAGRSTRASERVVGCCAHFLPVRSRITADSTVADVLGAIRGEVLAAFRHQDAPFAGVHAAPTGRLPFDAVFNLDRAIPVPSFHGLEGAFAEVTSRFSLVDFRIDAMEQGEGFRLDCDYRTAVLDEATAGRWCGWFRDLLDGMCRNPHGTAGSLLATADGEGAVPAADAFAADAFVIVHA